MTTVHISLVNPQPDGTTSPARATHRFTPTKRRPLTNNSATIVLPTPFEVALTDGTADVELEPNGLNWAWRIDEFVPGAATRTTYVAVPDITEVDYPDLVQLDPSTLDPSPLPQPAWIAAQNLALAATPELLMVGEITRDEDGAPLSAAVLWPDGSAGAYAGTPAEDFPGVIDAYEITHGPITYTQALVTRNTFGEIIAKPPITLS